MNSLRLMLKASSDPEPSTSKPSEFDPRESVKKGKSFDLGHGSEVFHVPRFLPADRSWAWFDYINKHIPWSRPTLRIFGRLLVQPRDSCYIAAEGLPAISYNGHTPRAYSWDDFPPLKDILDTVHKALPGSRFNSLVLNRYDGNNDYVSWHSDDEVFYGPTPEIASVTFGCEREFLLRKKPSKISRVSDDEPKRKRLRKSHDPDQHSFILKHGSLLVMRGSTQRDWLHSVPKRAKPMSIRINLTFRSLVVRLSKFCGNCTKPISSPFSSSMKKHSASLTESKLFEYMSQSTLRMMGALLILDETLIYLTQEK